MRLHCTSCSFTVFLYCELRAISPRFTDSKLETSLYERKSTAQGLSGPVVCAQGLREPACKSDVTAAAPVVLLIHGCFFGFSYFHLRSFIFVCLSRDDRMLTNPVLFMAEGHAASWQHRPRSKYVGPVGCLPLTTVPSENHAFGPLL